MLPDAFVEFEFTKNGDNVYLILPEQDKIILKQNKDF